MNALQIYIFEADAHDVTVCSGFARVCDVILYFVVSCLRIITSESYSSWLICEVHLRHNRRSRSGVGFFADVISFEITYCV